MTPTHDDSPQAVRLRAAAPPSAPPVRIFKGDGRSRVWQIDDPQRGRLVIKRFNRSPLRQRAALLMNLHPAQCELTMAAKLAAAGVPVVPIVDAGLERIGLGCRAWLALKFAGRSLQQEIRDTEGEDERLAPLLDAAADLTATLVNAGFSFKDLKPSNIIITPDGSARLIDVGSARASSHGKDVARMLGVMDRVLDRDGVVPRWRQYFAQAVEQRRVQR